MGSHRFAKSLLALSIAAMTAPVFALDWSYGGTYNLEGETLDDSVVTHGNFNADNGEAGIRIVGTVDPNNGNPVITPSIVKGSVTNNGSITSSRNTPAPDGSIPAGISISLSKIQGDVVNNGNINVTSSNKAQIPYGIAAIGSQIGGRIVNTGNIMVDGTGTGEPMAGLTDSSVGIYVDTGTMSSITNTGSIVAKGENSFGIVLESVILDPSKAQNQNGGIVINQQGGLIQGEEAAIDVSPVGIPVDLNWAGGSINGNVQGLDTITANGNVDFTGHYMDVGQLNVIGGTLALNQPNRRVAGNTQWGKDVKIEDSLNVGAGANLQLGLISPYPETEGVQGPVYHVGGGVSLDPGANLTASIRDYKQFADGNLSYNYNLLIAQDGISGIESDHSNVKSASVLQKMENVQLTNNDKLLSANIALKTEQEISDTVADGGGSRRSGAEDAAPIWVYDVMVNNDDVGPSDQVYDAFANASTNAELADLAEQLTPDNKGAIQAAQNSYNLLNRAIDNRMTTNRYGMSSGDDWQGGGFWVQAIRTDGDQNSRSGVSGFDIKTRGFAAGVDQHINPNLTFGLAYAYTDSDVDSDRRGNKVNSDGHTGSVYLGWTEGPVFVDGALSYGMYDNDAKRTIAGTRTKGSFDSSVMGANLLAGYTFDMGSGYVIEPRVAGRYNKAKLDSYHEKATSSAALNVNSDDFDTGELGAGVRFAGNFKMGEGNLLPELRAMGYHDLIGDEAKTNSSFVVGGHTFTTKGTSADRNTLETSLGLDYALGGFTVGGSYDYTAKSDYKDNTWRMKVRYDF